MLIRRATPDDLPQVAELFDAYRVWYRKTSDLAGATEFIGQRLNGKDSVIFVAEPDASDLVAEPPSLAGFTQLYPIFSSVRMKRSWLLNDLFVAPEFRSQGISKQLIHAAQQLARETQAAGVLLETEVTNEIGNRLYPATGFELEANNFYFWST